MDGGGGERKAAWAVAKLCQDCVKTVSSTGDRANNGPTAEKVGALVLSLSSLLEVTLVSRVLVMEPQVGMITISLGVSLGVSLKAWALE